MIRKRFHFLAVSLLAVGLIAMVAFSPQGTAAEVNYAPINSKLVNNTMPPAVVAVAPFSEVASHRLAVLGVDSSAIATDLKTKLLSTTALTDTLGIRTNDGTETSGIWANNTAMGTSGEMTTSEPVNTVTITEVASHKTWVRGADGPSPASGLAINDVSNIPTTGQAQFNA